MSPKKKSSSLNIQVWNMSGGNLPEGVVQAVTEAVESVVKDSENPRLLMNVQKG